ncbi:hypothetical protein [Mycobacterium sp. NAZ190054]|uniref:hypothetical protein n=1 Tax=Mycobacterium sp. NAZ190054 TaxID=1747766 RepID=UPI0007923F00|nr:hypothetical protein [Mycobacterium sp. NAZ190054]KWX66816.1 hypothetical protein ASJ79_05475 [Mycobacterium sp. NAZ190054]
MSQSQCQSCSAPTDLYICPRCVEELRAQLHSLAHGPEVNGRPTAGLLDNLADVVLKLTKLNANGGHRKKGDEMPVPYLPDVGKMVRDKKTGEETDEPVLSPQGRASQLLAQARNTLSTQVRDLCEHRGIDVMRAFRVVPADMVGPLMPGWRRASISPWVVSMPEAADWLACNVHAISCDEAAGQWRAEIDALVRAIKRTIDRPVRYELLGLCITQVDGSRTCDYALRAPEDAIEVRCPKCRTVRRCDTVRAQGQSDARKALITWDQVLETNKRQPDGWRVHERTLRDWRATGVIPIRGYLAADGKSHWVNRHSEDDKPLYKWGDVEQRRSQKRLPRGERKRTRAGR